MIIIIVILAFVLAWIFIEITLFLANKNYKDTKVKKEISFKKFIWNLRILVIFLFIVTTTYMHFFENAKFQQVIQYCFGIIK